MSSLSQSSALDDYFSAMLTVPVAEPEPEPQTAECQSVELKLAEPSVEQGAGQQEGQFSQSDNEPMPIRNTLFEAVEPVADPLPMMAEEPQHLPPFAVPEPDSSGTLQELDLLLESVVDIELEDLDLSLIQVDLDTVEDAQAETDEALALFAQQEDSLHAEAEVAELTVEEWEAHPTTAEESPVVSEVATASSSPEVELDTTSAQEPDDAEPEAEESWKNIELPEQFQALFFEVAGVTFAVPLTELGGIHQTENISSIFGKPEWFLGIMQNREQRLNVVDTAKWVMPEQNMGDIDYQYLVQLNGSDWGLGCEKLLGNETLNKNDIKWRESPGNRPWLAGMVKSRMCVLLHVEEMTKLLAGGINIHGQ